MSYLTKTLSAIVRMRNKIFRGRDTGMYVQILTHEDGSMYAYLSVDGMRSIAELKTARDLMDRAIRFAEGEL